MAQEPASPWSRWDTPGFEYLPQRIQPLAIGRQFDNPTYVLPAPGTPTISLADAALVDQRTNDDDPNFLDCIYSLPNAVQQVVEQCYVDLGCCEGGCCENLSWREKYGIAVALICIFCALVVIVAIVWLVFWLLNRSRDKAQRAVYETQSPAVASPHPTYEASPPPPQGYLY